MEVLLDK